MQTVLNIKGVINCLKCDRIENTCQNCLCEIWASGARFSNALKTFRDSKAIFSHLYLKTEECIPLKFLL